MKRTGAVQVPTLAGVATVAVTVTDDTVWVLDAVLAGVAIPDLIDRIRDRVAFLLATTEIDRPTGATITIKGPAGIPIDANDLAIATAIARVLGHTTVNVAAPMCANADGTLTVMPGCIAGTIDAHLGRTGQYVVAIRTVRSDHYIHYANVNTDGTITFDDLDNATHYPTRTDAETLADRVAEHLATLDYDGFYTETTRI